MIHENLKRTRCGRCSRPSRIGLGRGPDDGELARNPRTTCGRALISLLATSFALCIAGCGDRDATPEDVVPLQWAKTYAAGAFQRANAVYVTADGGYVVAGEIGFGTAVVHGWVLRLNAKGDVLWQKTIGSTDRTTFITSAAPSADGGIAVAGMRSSAQFGGNSDLLVVKLDANGNLVWQHSYGGAGDDIAYALTPTSDGGYVAAGYALSYGAGDADGWVVRLDANGRIVWQRSYGGVGYDRVDAIRQTPDGGFIAAGMTESPGAGHAWLLRIDGNGNVVWSKTFGRGEFSSIAITPDGGAVVAGHRRSFATFSTDPLVLRISAQGDVVWQRSFFAGSSGNQAVGVEAKPGGGAVAVGFLSAVDERMAELFVLSLDANGDVESQSRFGGPGYENANAVQATWDGGYVVVGETSLSFAAIAEAWVLKVDAAGSIPGCAVMATTAMTPSSVSDGGSSFPAIAGVTTASPMASSLVASDTGAVPVGQCFRAGGAPVAH
jgi:hypothetical protein